MDKVQLVVLTDGHLCFSKNVQLGEHDTSTERDCVRLGPEEICSDPPILVRTAKPVVHEEYDKSASEQHHDIALLPLKTDVNFTGKTTNL